MTKKEKECFISESISNATCNIEDILVENDIEAEVAFNVGIILGNLQIRVDELLKMEVTDEN